MFCSTLFFFLLRWSTLIWTAHARRGLTQHCVLLLCSGILFLCESGNWRPGKTIRSFHLTFCENQIVTFCTGTLCWSWFPCLAGAELSERYPGRQQHLLCVTALGRVAVLVRHPSQTNMPSIAENLPQPFSSPSWHALLPVTTKLLILNSWLCLASSIHWLCQSMCCLMTVISACSGPTFFCDLSLSRFLKCLHFINVYFPGSHLFTVDCFSSSGIHCVLATQWSVPYTSSSAVHTNTSNPNKITDLIFETCFCSWCLKTIFHQETVTGN